MALSTCIKPDFTRMITAWYQCQEDAHPDGNVYPWIVHTQTICSMEGQIARAFSVKITLVPNHKKAGWCSLLCCQLAAGILSMAWFPSAPAYCCEGSNRHHNARKPGCWGRSVKIDVLQEKRSAPCLVVHRTMTMTTPQDHLQMLIFYFQERHEWLLHISYSPPPQSPTYPANLRRNLHDERVPELLLLVLQTW